MSEARGGLTNLVSVTCGGNLIVASLIGMAAPLRRGKSVLSSVHWKPTSQVIRWTTIHMASARH